MVAGRMKSSSSSDKILLKPASSSPPEHRRRALSQTLRTSKFWLRLLQPWKWRRKKQYEKRTGEKLALGDGSKCSLFFCFFF